MTEPQFLTLSEVFDIHKVQIEHFGGDPGLRSRDLVESAVAMPQASFGGEFLHATIFEMAAAYAFHLAENQPFVDGNKRTALHAALTFLEMNGWDMDHAPDGAYYVAMISVGTRRWTKNDLARLFERLARRSPARRTEPRNPRRRAPRRGVR